MLLLTKETSFISGYAQSDAQKNNPLIIESGVTTAEQVKDMIGLLFYDDRYTPEKNITNALEKGYFCPGRHVTLRNWAFSLPNGELRIPDHVTLENCIVLNGRVIFSCGVCHAFGQDAVVIANGWNATGIAASAGAYVFATKAGARACGNAAGTFIIATVAGAFTIKNAADVQETPFDDFQHLVHAAKDSADTKADNHSACQFAIINLSEFYQSTLPIDTILTYLETASNNGCVEAKFHLGMAYFKNQQVAHDFERAETYFQQADQQHHQNAMVMIGELFSAYLGKMHLHEWGDRESTYSAIAYECYKLAAESGHPLALQRVMEYESSNLNFDRTLFGVCLPNHGVPEWISSI